MGTVFSRKPAISVKRVRQDQDYIGPTLLLMTNSTSNARFRLVPKSTTLDDLESPLRHPHADDYGRGEYTVSQKKTVPTYLLLFVCQI